MQNAAARSLVHRVEQTMDSYTSTRWWAGADSRAYRTVLFMSHACLFNMFAALGGMRMQRAWTFSHAPYPRGSTRPLTWRLYMLVLLPVNLKLSSICVWMCGSCVVTAVRGVESGRLKTRDWKTRHQTAGVENAGVAQYEKPKSPLFNIVTSVLQQPLELMWTRRTLRIGIFLLYN